MPSEARRPRHVRRAERRHRFQAERERAARTPKDRATAQFDRWRRALVNLPAIFADDEADEVAAFLRERAIRIEPAIEETTDDDR